MEVELFTNEALSHWLWMVSLACAAPGAVEGLHWNKKYFCTYPTLQLLLAVLCSTAPGLGDNVSQDWTTYDRDRSSEMKASWKSLACDTATRNTLFQKSLNFSSPLQKPSEVICSPASHHGTGISEPRQETSIPFQVKDRTMFSRSTHPEAGPSRRCCCHRTLAGAGGWKWPEDSSTARPLPG